MFKLFLNLTLVHFVLALGGRSQKITKHAANSGKFGYTGCPSNNDFYYEGVITSPLYPNPYPPSTECYYYMTAAPGKVLSFNFTHYDLETCCDYVTIYDGNGIKSPKLVQFGGQGASILTPSGIYTTTQRNALVTFQSDKIIQQSGFECRYDSVHTATPCNRDIILMLSGLSTVGSQDNFVKQLNFVANVLTPTWTVASDKIRVVINLIVDADYAVVWTADDLADNQKLTQAILGMTEDVPDVSQNNNTDITSVFKYAQGAVSFDTGEDKERNGISKVVIAFVPQNPNNDQDFYEAKEFAHNIHATDNSKVIVVAMGKNLDVARLSQLSYGSQFTFSADYDNLGSLVPVINKAICADPLNTCGA
ncbi:unnamed protein product [Cylicocyclus nassatus]|uniref:CUB domain-containing protein n=1 Tax=Cylicocyclus nassatus TaxID=53992 RepID=A0AA36GSE4_CYLNA|nr:unnamed protein product [Cylicocyclus nassatus]